MVSDGKEGQMQIDVAGISSMSFDWRKDGFGVPCDRCGAENAHHQLAGNLPSGIAGYYCDVCHNRVCNDASEYYLKLFEESTRALKTTVVSRREGKWCTAEMVAIASFVGEEVWMDSKHPKQLVILGHCAEGVFRALPKTLRYKIEHLVGMEKLPFVPSF